MIYKAFEYEKLTVYFERAKISNDILVLLKKRNWMDTYIVVATIKLNGRKLKFNRKTSSDMHEFILE